VLEGHALRDGRYQQTATSVGLPGLELSVLCGFLEHPTLTQAIRAFRAVLVERG
jgi:hypothetical protein